jgi:hypothetical protein
MGLTVFNSLLFYIKVKINDINEFKQLRTFSIVIPFILWRNILIILTITKMRTQYECFN